MSWIKKGLLDAILGILDKLKTINPSEPLTGAPSFKRIDIWNDQLKFEKDANGYTFPNPAIFLEMQQVDSKQLGMGVNLVDYEIKLHLIQVKYNNGSTLDRNLKIFGLRNLVKKQLQLWQAPQMGAMWFVDDEEDFDHDDVYHYITTFKAPLIDTWGNSFPTQGTASVAITVVYEHFLQGVSYDIIGDTLIVY